MSLATLDPEVEAETETESAVIERPSETIKVVRFLQRNWTILLHVSAIVLIPCLWHRHIEAGDLGSHEYISWLANLVEQGRAPGLFIAPQWNNIVVDFGYISWLGPRIGFAAAEKIIISACALTFFWGAFAFIAASTRRIPWTVSPAIAIVTYGFTFYAGFMNFYLSVGLALLRDRHHLARHALRTGSLARSSPRYRCWPIRWDSDCFSRWQFTSTSRSLSEARTVCSCLPVQSCLLLQFISLCHIFSVRKAGAAQKLWR